MLLLPNKGSLHLEEEKSLELKSQCTEVQALHPFKGSPPI